ncbi:MAG: DUF1573 domain-containing protein [Candidatus Melainabacteria bacterium]
MRALLARLPKWAVFALLLVLAVAAGWGIATVFNTPGLRPVVISVNYKDPQPMIDVEDPVADLGMVTTDAKARHRYIIYNVGGASLRLGEIETTCGCTVAKVSKKIILPGDFTKLDVTLDTSLKLGHVKKKIMVHSNDPEKPVLDLYLTGTVMPQMAGHNRVPVKDPLVLFQGECAQCHVQKGRGKTGRDLFVADCAMCHGMQGQGRRDIAPSLLNPAWEKPEERARLRGVIAGGSPNTPEMPPYSQAKGGPLSGDEIDSLVTFLRFQTDLHARGELEIPRDDVYAALEKQRL